MVTVDDLLPLIGKQEPGSDVSAGFGTVAKCDGSTIIIDADSGGQMVASSFAVVAKGDRVFYVVFGTSVVAVAGKDASTLKSNLVKSITTYYSTDGGTTWTTTQPGE